MLTNAPWYVSNQTLHRDLEIPHVEDVVEKRSGKHHDGIEGRPNQVNPRQRRRLRRRWAAEPTQEWRGRLAGEEPHHATRTSRLLRQQFVSIIICTIITKTTETNSLCSAQWKLRNDKFTLFFISSTLLRLSCGFIFNVNCFFARYIHVVVALFTVVMLIAIWHRETSSKANTDCHSCHYRDQRHASHDLKRAKFTETVRRIW